MTSLRHYPLGDPPKRVRALGVAHRTAILVQRRSKETALWSKQSI